MKKIAQTIELENHCTASTAITIGTNKKTNGCRNAWEQDIHWIKVSLSKAYIQYNGKVWSIPLEPKCSNLAGKFWDREILSPTQYFHQKKKKKVFNLNSFDPKWEYFSAQLAGCF